MGMDVYGVRPISERGEYFRRNVWGWHPLWEYVENCHPEIASLVKHAHTNDGDGLNALKSQELATHLFDDYKTGKVAEYVAERNRQISEMEMRDCEWCETTGIRSDEVGVKWGMPDKELSDEQKIMLGREKGYCNACDGVGKQQPWEASYYLEADDIKEFAEFLLDCGGFEIC